MEVLPFFLLLICVFRGGKSQDLDEDVEIPHWVSGVSIDHHGKSSPPIGSAAKPAFNQWKQQCGANPHLTIEKDFKECVDDIYGSLYTGTEEFTKSGDMCSPWTKHHLAMDTGGALESNFCRNNGQKFLWCLKAKKPGWEMCDVWTCSQKKQMGYWGTDVQKTPRKNRVKNPQYSRSCFGCLIPFKKKSRFKNKEDPERLANIKLNKRSSSSSEKKKKVPTASYIQGGKEVKPLNGWQSYVKLVIELPGGTVLEQKSTTLITLIIQKEKMMITMNSTLVWLKSTNLLIPE